MWVSLIRALIVFLGAIAVGIAAIPVLVMIDLLGDGTGFGLCPNGLDACVKPYSTGAEFAVILTLALFLVVFAIRLLMKLARRIQDDTYQVTQ
jgi:hypothetical protein